MERSNSQYIFEHTGSPYLNYSSVGKQRLVLILPMTNYKQPCRRLQCGYTDFGIWKGLRSRLYGGQNHLPLAVKHQGKGLNSSATVHLLICHVQSYLPRFFLRGIAQSKLWRRIIMSNFKADTGSQSAERADEISLRWWSFGNACDASVSRPDDSLVKFGYAAEGSMGRSTSGLQ